MAAQDHKPRQKPAAKQPGFRQKIKAWKTWQKALAVFGAVLLLLILSIGIFAWTQFQKVDNFIEDNFGTVAPAEPVAEIKTDPFIMYISGIDDRSGALPEHSRSDLNIIAVVNPEKQKLLLVNIPRDYYVDLPGLNAKDKLTHAGDIGGLELSTATVENLLDIKINYATRVNFNLLNGLVDAVGGVTINSNLAKTYTLYWDKSCVIRPGQNDLGGACAVAYARERLAYSEGDLTRAKNQEQIIEAIFQKIAGDKSILLNYGEILDSLSGNFETSLTADELKSLASAQLSNLSAWTVAEENLSVAGQGQEYGYLYPAEQKFVFYVDPASVKQAHDRITELVAE